MKALIISVVLFAATATFLNTSTIPKVEPAAKELKVEVSIDGTPYWVPVALNDVVHVVIDNNKLTTIKSYSNDTIY